MSKAEYVILRAQGVLYKAGMWDRDASEVTTEIRGRTRGLGCVSVGEAVDIDPDDRDVRYLLSQFGGDIDRREGEDFELLADNPDFMGAVYRNMIVDKWGADPKHTVVIEANVAGAIGAKDINCGDVVVLLDSQQSSDGFPKGITVIRNGLMSGVYDFLMKNVRA